MADVLTENEKAVLKALFEYFPEDEVFSLANTVTQNRIVVSNRENAVEAILNFSPSIESVLKRRKVKTEYMVQFMHDWNVPMNEKIEKPSVIRRFMENLPSTPQIPPTPSETISQPPPSPPPPSLPPPSQTPPSLPLASCSPPASSFGTAFLEQFLPWYVDLFNSGPPNLGPQHFWADSELRVAVQHAKLPPHSLAACGAEAVSSELCALHRAGLRLVPPAEVTPAAAGASVDSFGRVTLHLRGVAHHATVGGPAGIFQQALGLVQDVPGNLEPQERRYKIKFLQLEIEASIDPEAICAGQASLRLG